MCDRYGHRTFSCGLRYDIISPAYFPLASDVRDLSLDCECGADFLRFRLGVDASRVRFLCGLSGAGKIHACMDSDRDSALDAFSDGARSGPDQDEGRSLLARSHLSVLSPRNAADAESFIEDFSPRPPMVS